MSELFESISVIGKSFQKDFGKIPEERKQQLVKLSNYIKEKIDDNELANLIVICTHNSRRSHFGQIWLAVAASYYHLKGVQTFSGGTEGTAFNPNAVNALKRIGFEIALVKENSANPVYNIKWGNKLSVYQAFSKKYDSCPNPSEGFAAIMVCTEADKGCPVVSGADFRISLPFEDPKKSDGTPDESRIYDARCKEIGLEMFYVIGNV